MRATTAGDLFVAARRDDAFLVTDDDRRLLYLNRAACRLLGGPEEALLGRRVDEFLDPRSRPTFHRRWSTLLTRGSIRSTYSLQGPSGPLDVTLAAVANCPMPGAHLGRIRRAKRRPLD